MKKHRIYFVVTSEALALIARAADKAKIEEPNAVGKFAKEATAQRAAKLLSK